MQTVSNSNYLSNSFVFHRDKCVEFKDATLSIASAPVQYGLGVYTALNIVPDEGGKFSGFRLRDHYTRLCNSARIVGFEPIETKFSFEQFVEIVEELLTKNRINEPVIARAIYYVDEIMAGTKTVGLPCALSVFLLPYGDYFEKPMLDVGVSTWRRLDDNTIPPRAKITGSYVNAALMKSDALLRGFDDCIALDSGGHVAEGAVANIFMVRGGELITPSTSHDVLEGITRDSILQIAQSIGLKVRERSIDRTELYIADELFFSGSSARVWPIKTVDHRLVGTGQIGEITKILQKAYQEAQLGKLPAFDDWLHKMKYTYIN